jgi:hypothetical protein
MLIPIIPSALAAIFAQTFALPAILTWEWGSKRIIKMGSTAGKRLGRGWILGLLLGATTLCIPGAVSGDVAKPKIPSARGEQCVEPIDIMRRDHFDFMKHDRDKTVHEGVRSIQHSLAGCIDCHASRDAGGQFISINAEGQFCQTCHSYAAVKIDCFTCHAAVPATQVSQSP